MVVSEAGRRHREQIARRATTTYHRGHRRGGIALMGTEVNSLRMGRASPSTAGCNLLRWRELWPEGVHIRVNVQGTWTNHTPRAAASCRCHRDQSVDQSSTPPPSQRGRTIVPLSHFRDNRAKVEIGIATGKKAHDKRH